MIGLIIKIFICPITVLISSFIFPNVNFENLWQPIIVGLILAVCAHVLEIFILKEGTFWFSSIVDFIAASIIVYVVSLFFTTATVTIFGAFLTGLLLSITELAQHNWLIKSGKTEKSPT
ncbi:DUF2512 family protein [Salibacterium aidingense]|uniref:DUF2512 family protein n=1 Tax=Salibacterium aidingense TaxID=384933 RepID=UPI0004262B2F|nr:DUF2512 family protein [Salibacterium aidingense]